MSNLATRILAAAAIAIAAPSAMAIDGATRINQVAAVRGGVTPSDGPGFPVELDRPGRYVLTSNLDVPDANTDGIVLEAPGITLDLNGFRLTCSSCSAAGTGRGIHAQGGADDARVENGTVSNMGGDGVSATGARSHVSDVRIVDNRGVGIRVGLGGRVERAVVLRSGLSGVQASGSVKVSDTIVHGSGRHGISTAMGSSVQRCIVTDNAWNGIQGDYNSVFTANVTARNLMDGIQSFDSTVSHNNVIQQANGPGIRSEGSAVIGNLINDNQQALLATGTQTGFGQNVLTGNGADVSGPANSLGTNLCQTGVCP